MSLDQQRLLDVLLREGPRGARVWLETPVVSERSYSIISTAACSQKESSTSSAAAPAASADATVAAAAAKVAYVLGFAAATAGEVEGWSLSAFVLFIAIPPKNSR